MVRLISYIGTVFAACIFLAVPSAMARQPLMVNIDNPNFRKLSAATPTFYVADQKPSANARELSESGAKELGRLLQFSGLFNVMAEPGYREVVNAMNKTFRQQDAKRDISKTLPSTLNGIDVAQWKAIGVETVTVGRVEDGAGGLTLELRTADITRGEILLAKRYTKVVRSDYIRLIRRYANLIMEAYTGKPGIFSSKLVFVGRRTKSSNKQIYVSDFDGSNVIQITNEKTPHLSPHFSPDGRFVTYTSYRDGNPDLFLYELATGKRTKLSGHKGVNSGAQWAKNGKLIAFTGSVNGDADIYTISPNGGPRKLLIKGYGLDVDPTFSPNGKMLAFVSGRFGNPHIFVAPLEWTSDTNVRVLGDKRLTYAGWYNATPDWSPESDKIVFAGYDRDIDRFDIFMMNPDGTQLERLTLKKGNNESPSFAPNGQLIVFESNRVGNRDVKGVSQIYIMNRDGSNQFKLELGLYDAQTPSWSGPLY